MKILITGGLGYIGSHIAYKLGNKSIIIDDGSNNNLNFKKKLPYALVYKKKINYKNLSIIFNEHKIKYVMHLAGFKSVNESVNNPIKYYKNNIGTTIDVLNAMEKNKVENLLFSSSATVYDRGAISPLKENTKLDTNNPYGLTKLINEKIITEYSNTQRNFKSICLRYFNPIGKNPKINLSDQPKGEPQNLMPLLIKSILNKKTFTIFGDDYETHDGTCIRDYIHVEDLANSHIESLRLFKNIKKNIAINIGTGIGTSVLDLIRTFEKVNNIKIDYKIGKKRKGDVAICYADIKLSQKILKWKPKYNLEKMCEHAWAPYK